jgi:hypothetical protein
MAMYPYKNPTFIVYKNPTSCDNDHQARLRDFFGSAMRNDKKLVGCDRIFVGAEARQSSEGNCFTDNPLRFWAASRSRH